MSQALEALGVPIVSGNVSLYNESSARAIYPTPVVGMVGLIPNLSSRCGHAFAAEGDVVLLAGHGVPRLDGSEWLGEARGRPERPDLAAETALIEVVVEAAERGLLSSAHDVSAGGLATALAESAMAGDIGARVTLPDASRPDEALFGESGGRFVLTCDPEDLAALAKLFGDVPLATIGSVGGTAVDITVGDAGASVALEAARSAYDGGLREAMA
jgi:phosphoribosylformylglycinamidine synthase